MTSSPTRLCLACSSTVPDNDSTYVTECCRRPICERCLRTHPRLASYNPCLSCLGGVGVVTSAREANRKGLKVAGVNEDSVFVLGDSDDEDAEPESGTIDGVPPPYEEIEDRGRPKDRPEFHDIPSSSSQPGISDGGELSEKVPTASRNTEYWIKPNDTLVGIALKFGVDGRLLCKMNALPPSTLSVTPHLLHTRTTLVLPPTAKRPPTPPPTDVRERLEARAKEKAAKRLQFVTKETDPRVAHAYVHLAEGDPDEEHSKEDEKKRAPEDADLQSRAVDRYLADAEWEADQRRQGLGPAIPPIPFFGDSRAGSSKAKGKERWSWWR